MQRASSNKRRTSVRGKPNKPRRKSSSQRLTKATRTSSSKSRMVLDESLTENEQDQTVQDNDSSDISDTVQAAIKDLTSKSGPSTISNSALVRAVKESSRTDKRLQQAQREANAGFRSDKVKQLIVKSVAKAKPEERTLHHISLIVVYPYGVVPQDEEGDDFSPASKIDTSVGTLAKLADMGLCVRATSASPLYLDRLWNPDDVDTQLRKWLPLVWRYTTDEFFLRKESNPKHGVYDHDPDHIYLPELYLCEKLRGGVKPLTGPSLIFPNGELLWQVACDGGKSGIQQRKLIFVTRKPIPDTTLDFFKLVVQHAKKENCSLLLAQNMLEASLSAESSDDDIEEDKDKDKGKGKEKVEDISDAEVSTEIATEVDSDTPKPAKRLRSLSIVKKGTSDEERPTKVQKRYSYRNPIVVSSNDESDTNAAVAGSSTHLPPRLSRPAHLQPRPRPQPFPVAGPSRSEPSGSQQEATATKAPTTSSVQVESPPKPEFLIYYTEPNPSLEKLNPWEANF
ncbi:hypothetical protein C8R42DRAFT_720936 [Lentinula raphanica]|nr:hypothetical protein C8R42DRAFT_720936 [Lentinula raphanica]